MPSEPDTLVPFRPIPILPEGRPGPQQLLEAFFAGRNPRTLLAYRADLEDFRASLGAGDLSEAASRLLERGLAPATINRRITALRSLVRLGRLLGHVPWTLEIPSVRAEAYGDTRGPGREGFRGLLAQLVDRDDPKARRDRAVLRLLYDLALRRAEVVGLDVEDLDVAAGTVAVLGKGRTQKVRLTLPEPTRVALAAWLTVRGGASGPLLTNFDRARKGTRLTGTSVYRIVRGLGEAAGVRARPHGLRHAAITEALDVTRGDVRAVQKFSRHRDVRVIERYDDSRVDLAGDVARLVADGAADPPASASTDGAPAEACPPPEAGSATPRE
ncbi:MAG: tyrosine-type recombinase/integrase [Planctomycetales bacterium]|nr:tyrosine-type recombinase/integrase [Planctomycetales bacterium]